MKYKKVIVNKAKCLICNQVLESKFAHDFKSCRCGNLSVDGGLEYVRRGYKDKDSYQELSEYNFINIQNQKSANTFLMSKHKDTDIEDGLNMCQNIIAFVKFFI